MRRFCRMLCLGLLLGLPGFARAHGDYVGARPDGHAPMDVMGDHTHAKGEWMLSYRFMTMGMEGLLDGTTEVTAEEATSMMGSYGYMMVPIHMERKVHAVGAMFAASNRLTLTLMAPLTRAAMTMRNRMGQESTVKSSGMGDLGFSGLVTFYRGSRSKAHLNLGLGFPTGSIDAKDDTTMGADQPLAYGMQLGSGSLEARPGVTYLRQWSDCSIGCQVSGVFRVNRNSHDYRLGSQGSGTVWLGVRLAPWLSLSGRTAYLAWGDIDGSDSALSPMAASQSPGSDPLLKAGKRWEAGWGINLYVPRGALKNGRIAAEYIHPIHQDLDGPQGKMKSRFVVGWQQSFG